MSLINDALKAAQSRGHTRPIHRPAASVQPRPIHVRANVTPTVPHRNTKTNTVLWLAAVGVLTCFGAGCGFLMYGLRTTQNQPMLSDRPAVAVRHNREHPTLKIVNPPAVETEKVQTQVELETPKIALTTQQNSTTLSTPAVEHINSMAPAHDNIESHALFALTEPNGVPSAVEMTPAVPVAKTLDKLDLKPEVTAFVERLPITSVVIDGERSLIRTKDQFFNLNSIVYDKYSVKVAEINNSEIIFTDREGTRYHKLIAAPKW